MAKNLGEKILKSIWRSVLHHITNKHEWILSNGGVNHCLHGELGEEERTKPWLSHSEHAHVKKDLATIVLDKMLLNNVGYYLKFRARNRLAALDHNMYVKRPVQKNNDGTIRYHRVFNKKSGRWTVHAVKIRKQYQYIQTLLASDLIMRINDRVGMKTTVLAPDDPRLISKHLIWHPLNHPLPRSS
uniref:Uncharacterized protein LOC111110405 n=1 Tax=Crassostrea virginica TaxID=6565 RepID=A0A8B8BIF2_CRAVI|nr:uncharacterized protein LOC111110405 [Crassostrea virginica]